MTTPPTPAPPTPDFEQLANEYGDATSSLDRGPSDGPDHARAWNRWDAARRALLSSVSALAERAAAFERFVHHAELAYVGSEVMVDVLGFLEAAGCGKPGTPNTLWAMTQEIIARASAAEEGWKRCAADLASETRRANESEVRAEALSSRAERAEADGARFKEQRDNAWKDLETVGNVLGAKIEAGQDFARAAARVMNLGAEKLAAAESRLAEAEADGARWKETALTIQRNLAETHDREKHAEWLRGHTEGMEDNGKALDALSERLADIRGLLAHKDLTCEVPSGPDEESLETVCLVCACDPHDPECPIGQIAKAAAALVDPVNAEKKEG